MKATNAMHTPNTAAPMPMYSPIGADDAGDAVNILVSINSVSDVVESEKGGEVTAVSSESVVCCV